VCIGSWLEFWTVWQVKSPDSLLLLLLSCCPVVDSLVVLPQSVKWAEDVEDYDENAGKRKSKSESCQQQQQQQMEHELCLLFWHKQLAHAAENIMRSPVSYMFC
jgi:ectoine hydroxylase-related dioxygenase (phytanoyl-CoA dioxygenase family)